MALPFPPKPPISPQSLAYLEGKGVPAVAAILAKLPKTGLIPSKRKPAFAIGLLDGYKMVCVTRDEAEQWLRWKRQTSAAWVKVVAVTSIIAAVAVVAAIRG